MTNSTNNICQYDIGMTTAEKLKAKNFDIDAYLKTTKGISRINMPQVKFDEFLNVALYGYLKDEIEVLELPISELKATQKEINWDKCLDKIVSPEKKNLRFIISSDNFIADGHHSHVCALIKDQTQTVTVYRFKHKECVEMIQWLNEQPDLLHPPKNINETKTRMTSLSEFAENIFESYGQQGPATVPGIGAVTMPDAVGSGEITSPDKRGSGDVPAIDKKIKKKKSVLGMDPNDPNHPLKDVLDANK